MSATITAEQFADAYTAEHGPLPHGYHSDRAEMWTLAERAQPDVKRHIVIVQPDNPENDTIVIGMAKGDEPMEPLVPHDALVATGNDS